MVKHHLQTVPIIDVFKRCKVNVKFNNIPSESILCSRHACVSPDSGKRKQSVSLLVKILVLLGEMWRPRVHLSQCWAVPVRPDGYVNIPPQSGS